MQTESYSLKPGHYHVDSESMNHVLFAKPFPYHIFRDAKTELDVVKQDINIGKCTFQPTDPQTSVSGETTMAFSDVRFTGMFIFGSSFSNELRFVNVDFSDGRKFDENAFTGYWSGHLDLQDDIFQNLNFYSFKGKVFIKDCTFSKHGDTIETSNSNIVLKVIGARPIAGRLNISDHESNILLAYLGSEENSTAITLANDTVADLFLMYHKGSQNLNFSDTRFTGGRFVITPDSMTDIKKLSFDNCHFDTPINFGDYRLDTLKIINCKKIANPIVIDHTITKKVLYVDLTNSDVNNIDFTLADNMQLIFDRTATTDDKEKVYLSLLDKFKKEGKSVSYQNVDIQYQKFSFFEYGFLGKLWSYIDYKWWNYGYDKWKIIIWTIILVTLFFLINLLRAPLLFSFYPIFNDKTEHPEKSFGYLANKVVLIFVLTLYIFFGLKVDFDKLKSRQTGMMVYFFLQYFIGLICLFFLFNAILKL